MVHLNKLKKCYGVTPESWFGVSSDAEISGRYSGSGVAPVSEVLHSPAQAGVSGFTFNSDVSSDDSSSPVVQKLPVRRRSRPKYLSDYLC